MERTRWTDERIDDMVERLDKTIARTEGSLLRLEASVASLNEKVDRKFERLYALQYTLLAGVLAVLVGIALK